MRIGKLIDRFFKQNGSQKILELTVSPREIWEELQVKDLNLESFHDLNRLHDGDLEAIWYRGAKLIRRRRQNDIR